VTFGREIHPDVLEGCEEPRDTGRHRRDGAVPFELVDDDDVMLVEAILRQVFAFDKSFSETEREAIAIAALYEGDHGAIPLDHHGPCWRGE
jgi:hypothetical protein